MAERSEAKSANQNISNLRYLDAKLRFALLASLRSAIFSETELDNSLDTFPALVKKRKNSKFLVFFVEKNNLVYLLTIARNMTILLST